jgi:hypothetical protein
MTQLIKTKEENGLIIKVYAPVPVKHGLTCKNKASTKITRAELGKIQCQGEANEKTN